MMSLQIVCRRIKERKLSRPTSTGLQLSSLLGRGIPDVLTTPTTIIFNWWGGGDWHFNCPRRTKWKHTNASTVFVRARISGIPQGDFQQPDKLPKYDPKYHSALQPLVSLVLLYNPPLCIRILNILSLPLAFIVLKSSNTHSPPITNDVFISF